METAPPQWSVSKSGEVVSPRFLQWVADKKGQLLRSFPPAEKRFATIIDCMTKRMGRQHVARLRYTRQKSFIIAENVVFFGDFYFRNLRTLVEIDGLNHVGPAARERDAWRSRMIELWKTDVIRIHNDTILESDFREIERWFVDTSDSGRYGWRSLKRAHTDMTLRHPEIYG